MPYSPKQPEQAVIVHFQYGRTDLQPLSEIEARLEAAIKNAGVGEFDGDEIAEDGSDGSLYMYGPDADNLFAIVQPILNSSDFMQGAFVTVRYGPPQVSTKEFKVKIGV